MLDIVIAAVCVVFVILIWFMLYDSNRFVVIQHTFCDPRIKKPYRAVMLSDLHGKRYGKDNALLIDAVRRQNPDAVLIAGDMVSAQKKSGFEGVMPLLEALAKEFPIYYVNGNHEQRLKLYPEDYGNVGDRYEKALREIGIERMVNVHVTLPDVGVCVYGAEIDRQYYKRGCVPQMEAGYMEEILGRAGKDAYTVLLAHNPDYFPQYAAWGADLVLSGHIHGGMVRIPFWKGVVSPAVKLFPKYDGGVFREAGSVMLLGRGLGMHTIPVRLFNPGELLVIDLLPGKDSKAPK